MDAVTLRRWVFGMMGLIALGWACHSGAGATPIAHAYVEPTFQAASGETHTRLSNGALLMVGGEQNGSATRRAMLQDAVTTLDFSPSLQTARARHTATVLPDGRVLIWGGVDDQGRLITVGELFDPKTKTFTAVDHLALLPRADHTATVLTDGRLLVSGGWNDEFGALKVAELWDYRTGRSELLESELALPRLGDSATLLADGRVLIVGGYDALGKRFTYGALFDPDQVRFIDVDVGAIPAAAADGQTPQLAGSIPLPEASDFPVTGIIALRFSRLLDASTVGPATITLLGPGGVATAAIVAAENGRLAFITPDQDLFPASRYTLFVNGARAAAGDALPFTALGFSTQALGVATAGPNEQQPSRAAETARLDGGLNGPDNTSPVVAQEPALSMPSAAPEGRSVAASTKAAAADVDADELWLPGAENSDGRWRTNRPLAGSIAKLINERLSRNSTAAAERNNFAAFNKAAGVFGQVLKLNDKPLDNVTISIGGVSTRTDANGAFELLGLPAGRQEMFVDGSSATTTDKEYAQFVIGVDVKPGKMTAVPPIYLPRIRAQDWVSIPSPIQTDLVVNYPGLPGMSVMIPKGAVLRDRAGHVLTRIAIVPLPLDRLPFQVPENFPSYFSLQPGGLIVQGLSPATSPGVRVSYLNLQNEPPGRVAALWNYEPKDRGWYVYGSGKVSADGKYVEADPGVAIYESIGFSVSFGPDPGPQPPPPPCGPCSGDPVDTKTGLFLHTRSDLALNDILPLALTRTYRPDQSATPLLRPFGKATTHTYAMYLYSPTPYTFLSTNLILPDGSVIPYTRISPGTSFADAVFEHVSTPGKFYKSQITYANPYRWVLRLKDGTSYEFDAHASSGGKLTGMRDRFGNFLEVTRTGGRISRITTPSGRYVDFSYDTSNRISQIQDLAGRTVIYQYITSGLNADYLWKVTDPENFTEEYTYYDTAPAGRLWKVKDKRGNYMVVNEYYTAGADNGRIFRQTLADSGTYVFAYVNDGMGQVTQTDITDPRLFVRRITFHTTGYPSTDTYALGELEAQTMSYERQAVSGLVTATVDALGRRTEYEYDDRGNVQLTRRLAHLLPSEQVIEQFSYSTDYNQIETYTNPLSKMWRYRYFPLGLLKEVEDPLVHITRFTYTGAGQIKMLTNPINKTTTFDYDLYDLRTMTDPLAHSTSYFTDLIGRQKSVTDATNLTTQFEYDKRSLMTKTIDAKNQETILSYDENGNLTSVRDARLGLTQYGYDTKNRQQSRTDPLLKTETFVYDKMNNLIRGTDRKNQVTAFDQPADIDPLNRVKHVRFHDAATIDYSYDAGNRLRQIVDSVSGTISRDYDDLDRLTRETTPQGRLDYGYDKASRRQTLQVAGQAIINYGYDDANRLRSIGQATATVGMSYDDASRRTSLLLPNGIELVSSYDDANRLQSITYRQGATTLGNLTYNYDDASRRTGAGGSYARSSLPDVLGSASYDLADRLSSWDGRAPSYDDNGNLTADGLRIYTWDVRDRLTGVSGTTSASFIYDAVGRRISKTVSGSTTKYLHDWLNPVQELDNTTTPTANLLTGLGIDQFFSRTDALGARHLLTDALGSTLALTDNAGAIKTEYTYSAYGGSTQTGESNANPFQYTGRENDGTGLYYYRARYYDPLTSRFIAEDPIGLGGGINLYGYVSANPLSGIDPYGTDDWAHAPEWNWGVKPGVPLPGGPNATLYVFVACLRNCYGAPFTVTSTDEPSAGHPPGTPHNRGVAVDIRGSDISNPKKLLCCAKSCGAQFAQDETLGGGPSWSGSHYHFQLPTGARGGRGDLPTEGQCTKPCAYY